MTQNKKIILDFINENLEWGDNTIIAESLNVNRDLVSRVRNGHQTSAPIMEALLKRAMEHRATAMKIAEYSKKSIEL